MWLLTPVNVTVNIEELRNANAGTTTGALIQILILI